MSQCKYKPQSDSILHKEHVPYHTHRLLSRVPAGWMSSAVGALAPGACALRLSSRREPRSGDPRSSPRIRPLDHAHAHSEKRERQKVGPPHSPFVHPPPVGDACLPTCNPEWGDGQTGIFFSRYFCPYLYLVDLYGRAGGYLFRDIFQNALMLCLLGFLHTAPVGNVITFWRREKQMCPWKSPQNHSCLIRSKQMPNQSE